MALLAKQHQNAHDSIEDRLAKKADQDHVEENQHKLESLFSIQRQDHAEVMGGIKILTDTVYANQQAVTEQIGQRPKRGELSREAFK